MGLFGKVKSVMSSVYLWYSKGVCLQRACLQVGFLNAGGAVGFGKGLLPLELGGFQRSSAVNGSIEKAGGMDRVALMGWTEQL